MKNKESVEYRKIQAGIKNHSLSFVIPKKYCTELGIMKADYLKISKRDDGLFIEKLVTAN